MTKRAAHYTIRVANEICKHIALGMTLNQALEATGWLAPTIETCYRWLDEHEDFRVKYERARTMQADMHADKMLELSQEVLNKPPMQATAYRVAIDVLKWQAEIRNRARYGRKIEDAKDRTPMDATKLRAEIKRLETELGVAESKVVPMKAVK